MATHHIAILIFMVAVSLIMWNFIFMFVVILNEYRLPSYDGIVTSYNKISLNDYCVVAKYVIENNEKECTLFENKLIYDEKSKLENEYP